MGINLGVDRKVSRVALSGLIGRRNVWEVLVNDEFEELDKKGFLVVG